MGFHVDCNEPHHEAPYEMLDRKDIRLPLVFEFATMVQLICNIVELNPATSVMYLASRKTYLKPYKPGKSYCKFSKENSRPNRSLIYVVQYHLRRTIRYCNKPGLKSHLVRNGERNLFPLGNRNSTPHALQERRDQGLRGDCQGHELGDGLSHDQRQREVRGHQEPEVRQHPLRRTRYGFCIALGLKIRIPFQKRIFSLFPL